MRTVREPATDGTTRLLWGKNPGFGAYLRKHREHWNLSLRKASLRIGCSHTYLDLLEKGGSDNRISAEIVAGVARTYQLDPREVEYQAGWRREPVEPLPAAALEPPKVFARRHPTTFGPYMRSVRQARGLSLRDAADQLGVTFTKLQKMETGGRFRLPDLTFLFDLADLYCLPRTEVLREAGIEVLTHEAVREQMEATPVKPSPLPRQTAAFRDMEQMAIDIDAPQAADVHPADILKGHIAQGWRVAHLVPVMAYSLDFRGPHTSSILVVFEREKGGHNGNG